MKRVLNIDGQPSVIVLVQPPEIVDNTDDHFMCQYTIDGLSSKIISHGMGIDEIQATLITLQLIGNRLHSCDEFRSGRLSWIGGLRSDDLGFPQPAASCNGR